LTPPEAAHIYPPNATDRVPPGEPAGNPEGSMSTDDPEVSAGAEGGDGPTAAAAALGEAAPEQGAEVGPEAPEASPQRTLEAVERELETARVEAEQAREQALRARAEADNLRKRAERDLENAHRFALERFVAELLPVKDSMELGLAAQTAGAEQLREGMEMTLRMLATASEKFGVREVDPAGARFDPELHQAMSTRAAEDVEPGTVVQVVQKGYLLNDRLVRPALVIVAQ
jgi:molecular chaperone GrpE